jgi:hypothetical protein
MVHSRARGIALIDYLLLIAILLVLTLPFIVKIGKSAGYSAFMSGCSVQFAHSIGSGGTFTSFVGGGTETGTAGTTGLTMSQRCHDDAERAGYDGVAPFPDVRYEDPPPGDEGDS